VLAGGVASNVALDGWVLLWSAALGWQTFALVQGTTLVGGGAIAAWMLHVQHQYEDTYYRAPNEWSFELSALQGSS
jgi:omega-6 fatty acid desaturase (delta-12 desaturase)